MEIDHLSPSQINQYLRCSMQWYYVKTRGYKPGGVFMLAGVEIAPIVVGDCQLLQRLLSRLDQGGAAGYGAVTIGRIATPLPLLLTRLSQSGISGGKHGHEG